MQGIAQGIMGGETRTQVKNGNSGSMAAASATSVGVEAEYVYSYARKSNEDRRALKSIEDQNAANFDTAAEWNLPLRQENMLAEKVGHGGDEYWEGGGSTGLPGDHFKGRTRPVLTQLVRGVAAGEVKVVIVWSLCRLWRDVAICETLIKLFARHGCSLYDRNGLVDICTPEGRQAVRANAIAAQNMREMSAANAPRGTRRSRAKGKAVTNCNRLGFRSIKGTGTVLHVPEEQELVRDIFKWYDQGINMRQIANQLNADGYQWLPHIPRARRTSDSAMPVYAHSIKAVLVDCRYQGRIPHEAQEWPCAQLLVDGKPIIEEALWERVQKKLAQRRPGAPGHRSSHSLSGIVRCGICGQSMRRASQSHTMRSGTQITYHSWESMQNNQNNWCTHELPPVQVDDLDQHISTVLAPLLLEEIRERASDHEESAVRNDKAVLERKLSDVQTRMRDLAAKWARGELGLAEYQDARQASTSYEAELKDKIGSLERRLLESAQFTRAIECFDEATMGARRDAIRQVIQWVAVIPSGKPQVKIKGGKRRRATDAGRVVICTVWGTLHTACIERRPFAVEDGAKVRRRNFLREATLAEAVGTIADFPDPERFIAGLARGRAGHHGWNTPKTSLAPCYRNEHEVSGSIAEFELESIYGQMNNWQDAATVLEEARIAYLSGQSADFVQGRVDGVWEAVFTIAPKLRNSGRSGG